VRAISDALINPSILVSLKEVFVVIASASDIGGILRIVRQASSILDSSNPDHGRALELLEPYRLLTSVEGVETERSDALLALVSSAFADAYRERGEFGTAADWYRKSSNYRVAGGYTDLYADMVITHHLTEHYEHALHCLREGRKAWSEESLFLKIIGHGLSFIYRLRKPEARREYRELKEKSKDFERILLMRIK
jgi:tetratricopeptide (TPR) repeat protein